MKRLPILMLIATVTLWTSIASAETITWKVDGETRQAIIYAPSTKSAGGKAPLVFSFHGHGDNMQNFQYTGIQQMWPEAIVVYFQGLPSRDGLSGWQVEKGEYHDRDLKLVDAALASLRGRFQIDDTRIYATGFSNGANFTYLLWAERPGVFAAYAPVAARLRSSVHLTQPKPLLHIAGMRDSQIPFADQKSAIEIAKRTDGVAGEGTSCGNGCTVYGANTANPVMTWIHAGGHEYPPSTSERIVKFFRDHNAPGSN